MAGGRCDWTIATGEQPLSAPPLELFIRECAVLCHPSPEVTAHKAHLCWHCPCPSSLVGTLATYPGVPQSLFSQGHRPRSAEGRLQEHSGCAPGPTMEAAQSQTQPGTGTHTHTYTAHSCQEQTFPASGEPAVHLDDLQLLSSQRRPW